MVLNKTFKIVHALSRDTHDFTIEFNLKPDFNMKLYLRISPSNNSTYCSLVETCLPFCMQDQNLQEENFEKNHLQSKQTKLPPNLVNIYGFKCTVSIVLLTYVKCS